MSASEGNADLIKAIYEDPRVLLTLTFEDFDRIDYDVVKQIQLHFVQKRFAELRLKIKAVDNLASTLGIDRLETLEDVVPMCFPHTVYKGYRESDVENGRFDRLIKWLSTLTAVDLSKVDLDGCDSLEDWLNRIERDAPLRPVSSSGTSGKISIFPRGKYEEEHTYWRLTQLYFAGYHGRGGIDITGGDVPFLTPWPNDEGRHNIPVIFRQLRERVYPHDPDMVVTLGKGCITANELWLGGRVRRAQNRGEQINLTDAERATLEELARRGVDDEASYETFVRRAVVEQEGKRVVFFGAWHQIYRLVTFCRDKGIPIRWAPDSLIWTGGGSKGHTFPDGWQQEIFEAIPVAYPDRYTEAYGSTEHIAGAYRCHKGHLHPVPWSVPFVLDPTSGEPLPRTGTQTGRFAGFDILAETYWGGSVSGDEVTVHWDGGCSCGRVGPFYNNNITRYIDTRAGDDKISCAKTPDAYNQLREFAVGFE
ncbi:hypothetical protein SAMN02927924_00123 [Sphingobium faniae]|nr:hypothetical protein SAMN02927924_00123 [Sphingobium faniae]